MSILFGHPVGSPFSHNAALAHLEEGILEAFCVPWMPTPIELQILNLIPGCSDLTARLSRRCFPPLLQAERLEGKKEEWGRLLKRIFFKNSVDSRVLSNDANHWLMQTMKKECHRRAVNAIHSYEDCSLWAFDEAKRLGKACIYDMPIGYYPAWYDTEATLIKKFKDWLPSTFRSSQSFVHLDQKVQEMNLADIVLTPCSFAMHSIQRYVDKDIFVAPYGVDLVRWFPSLSEKKPGPLTFIYAGHISIRKGLPLLFEAWNRAELKDARLLLVGTWMISENRKHNLPDNIDYLGHCSADQLRIYFQQSDVFVFPSYFEGFGMVISEAMACGLPVLASDATAAGDIIDDSCGRVFPSGEIDSLIEYLRFFCNNRDMIPSMKLEARSKAETMSWENYRKKVRDIVRPLF